MVENHSKWAGLQIADCATSAFFMALQPNPYGNYEPAYASHLKDKLISTKGRVLNWGLAGVPKIWNGRLDAQQDAFLRGFIKS